MSHYGPEREADEAKPSPTIEDTLNERGARYGSFVNQAQLSQGLKNAVMQHYFNTHGGAEATPLPPYMAESISMICHKLARIANGDPMYDDSWRDISGFATLVVEELTSKARTGN